MLRFNQITLRINFCTLIILSKLANYGQQSRDWRVFFFQKDAGFL